MKKLILLTTLTISAAPLTAQQAQNREGIGDTPTTPATIAPEAVPAVPDKASGETASDRSPDEQFIRNAVKAGRIEVKVAELAVTQAVREDLKAFAAVLVKDHTAANAELAEIAKTLGVDLPEAGLSRTPQKTEHAKPENDASGRQQTETVPKDPSAEATANKHQTLKEKSGGEFDTAFMEVMEECHAKDIALFEKAQAQVKTPALKAFVDKTLPVLRSHATALVALERKDPSRPDAKTGSPPVTDPALPGADRSPPNR